jgi:hypothetical protein
MIIAMIVATILQRVGARVQDCRNFAESCARRTDFQKSYPAGPVENGSLEWFLRQSAHTPALQQVQHCQSTPLLRPCWCTLGAPDAVIDVQLTFFVLSFARNTIL